MLQVGGVHEAVTEDEPAWIVPAEQVVRPVQAVEAATAAGSDELQVNAGLGTMHP